MTATATSGAGARMQSLASEFFPFRRSITGDGVRRTLREIAKRIPLELHEVATGTQVLNWTVPDDLPEGEPELGKRGRLFRGLGVSDPGTEQPALLNQSGGSASLLDVADRSGLPFARIMQASAALPDAGLLAEGP